MAASAVFILDLKGHVILFRDYRGDVPIKYAERFITKLNELEETGKVMLSPTNEISHHAQAHSQFLHRMHPLPTGRFGSDCSRHV